MRSRWVALQVAGSVDLISKIQMTPYMAIEEAWTESLTFLFHCFTV